jgi:hypothetical protein
VAKIKWDQSLAVVEAGVEEAFDTLVTLFGGDGQDPQEQWSQRGGSSFEAQAGPTADGR